MVIASIIIGILLIIGGISCIAAPVDTYLKAAYLLAVMLLAYGIFGIVRFFKRRALVPEFLVSILAVIIGFVYIYRPGGTPPAGNLIGLDRFVLFVIAAWFLIKGLIYLVLSVRTRFVNRKWIWGFLIGLLSIIVGIYSFMQPTLAAAATGTIIGICFVQCGIEMLFFGTTTGFIRSAINEVENSINSAVEEVRTAARNTVDELRANIDAAADDASEPVDASADEAESAEKNEGCTVPDPQSDNEKT